MIRLTNCLEMINVRETILPPLFLFDYNDTLVTTEDKKWDKSMLYLDRREDMPIKEMWDAFNFIKEKYQAWILTTLHPITCHFILNFTDCEFVMTRDFCLTIEEMQKVINSKEETDKFMKQMVEYKSREIRQAAERRIVVFYIDDIIDMFKNEVFPSNVIMLSPKQFLEMLKEKI